jgi:hypothetical protein
VVIPLRLIADYTAICLTSVGEPIDGDTLAMRLAAQAVWVSIKRADTEAWHPEVLAESLEDQLLEGPCMFTRRLYSLLG